MPSDPKRVDQVYQHIQRIKAGDYPLIRGSSDDRDGPYRIVERPWKEVPEASKLAILQDAVNWQDITNRDQAHILLAEIDPGKITDAQRNRLIDMAEVKEPQYAEDRADVFLRHGHRSVREPPKAVNAPSPEKQPEPPRRRR